MSRKFSISKCSEADQNSRVYNLTFQLIYKLYITRPCTKHPWWSFYCSKILFKSSLLHNASSTTQIEQSTILVSIHITWAIWASKITALCLTLHKDSLQHNSLEKNSSGIHFYAFFKKSFFGFEVPAAICYCAVVISCLSPQHKKIDLLLPTSCYLIFSNFLRSQNEKNLQTMEQQVRRAFKFLINIKEISSLVLYFFWSSLFKKHIIIFKFNTHLTPLSLLNWRYAFF